MTWRRWTTSAWNSSTVAFGDIWINSQCPFAKKPHNDATTGTRIDGSLCRCLPCRMSTWSAPDGQSVLGLPCSLRQRLLQRRPCLFTQRGAYQGFCLYGKDFLQRGRFICEWPRVTAKSQWSTAPNHFPTNNREISEWNGTYFTWRAMTLGPNTGEVIKRIFFRRKLEVQTYRICQGVLSFTRKYSRQALEETCRQALDIGK